MLCDNCGKREANVRYTENINGRRRELNLCEECSRKLGIGQMDFSMPVDFSSFLGGFMDELTSQSNFMPMFNTIKENRCNNCNSTFDDIINTGMLGCENCYNEFSDELDPIIKRLQGSNRHIGRVGKIVDNEIKEKINKAANKNTKKEEKVDKKLLLQRDLEQAIKEERYEDAAKIRDQIKELEKDAKNSNKEENNAKKSQSKKTKKEENKKDDNNE